MARQQRQHASPAATAPTDGEAFVFVAPSPIHGKGLFAARTIPKGTLIGRLEGVPARRDGTYVLWYTDDEGNEVGLRGTNALRYVNHASRPNAIFYGLELSSLRRIRKGEEITHDYGPAWEGR